MSMPISRRGVLVAGVGTAAGVAVPGVAARADATGRHDSVEFTLNARTLDGGEQVTALTLDVRRLGPVDPASLSRETFSVHVSATNPIPGATAGQYEADRLVTAARLDRSGSIVLELSHGEGQPGGATLGYIPARGRNVRLTLDYTITQNDPLARRHGKPFTIQQFVQGRLSNPEVDAFSHHVSGSGMNYRLFEPDHPAGHGRRPLIVWLHGGGEGGSAADNYYDNETPLRANRGALGFATKEGQRIFGGAYVVAPQSPSAWMQDGPRFAPLIREVIQEVVNHHSIDRDRIYVVGCSNGGYMSLKMTVVYPRLFAASVPICGVVAGDPPLIPDPELESIRTPTWLVTSLDDATVDPEANTVHAHELIPSSRVTLYEHVIWDGYQFPGHWSWIYVAHNDPSIKGVHLWQWMARQGG